ncbi:hypothetical protein SUGI_0388040 [Cryptomeria japonica]|nr:hypothetical protein SUGI_0388040 [Cryptomeria japonica]
MTEVPVGNLNSTPKGLLVGLARIVHDFTMLHEIELYWCTHGSLAIHAFKNLQILRLVGYADGVKPVNYVDAYHHHSALPKRKAVVELIAVKESTIGQTITTVPGKKCDLKFVVGDAGNHFIGEL